MVICGNEHVSENDKHLLAYGQTCDTFERSSLILKGLFSNLACSISSLAV